MSVLFPKVRVMKWGMDTIEGAAEDAAAAHNGTYQLWTEFWMIWSAA
jgi:hypothetical protein